MEFQMMLASRHLPTTILLAILLRLYPSWVINIHLDQTQKTRSTSVSKNYAPKSYRFSRHVNKHPRDKEGNCRTSSDLNKHAKSFKCPFDHSNHDDSLEAQMYITSYRERKK
ncbi:hypothetical protein NPIL_361871 [Nephila pilipes]|uniref:Uncharacterized protein n=1 Tax=Nephila pilipes TaxID=299642 RepID=A0A8X6QCX1_NEPPI|nr:hypothetical protein NPIL_361871 [Nephila pilipes]